VDDIFIAEYRIVNMIFATFSLLDTEDSDALQSQNEIKLPAIKLNRKGLELVCAIRNAVKAVRVHNTTWRIRANHSARDQQYHISKPISTSSSRNSPAARSLSTAAAAALSPTPSARMNRPNEKRKPSAFPTASLTPLLLLLPKKHESCRGEW
jgi:hypothetical protein